MKKVISMVALAAISFGSVYALVPAKTTTSVMQMDTTKKKVKKMKRDSTRKKDSTKTDHAK